MRKIAIAIILAFLFISTYSQSCLTEGITFETQAQIDSFQINYPNCIEIEGDVMIGGEDISDLNGLNTVTSIGGSLLFSFCNSLPDLTGLNNLTSIGESLRFINNNGITSFTGLGNLTHIGNKFEIGWNNQLASLSGLEEVSIIGGSVRINNNPSLSNISGLGNVTNIGGTLYLTANDLLVNLSGLEKLISLGDGLWLHNNSSLNSIEALSNLKTIESSILIYSNPLLSSLSGLDNLDSIGNALDITNNISLSSCDVQGICNYLSSPNGTVDIQGNATGCSSKDEVEEACGLQVGEQFFDNYLSLFPNPANQELNISTEGFNIDEVTIYSLTGKQIMKSRPLNGIIDISGLHPGMYIVEVVVENIKLRRKLIVE